ncbi:hypothetical protein MC7420_7825 [Coleofasciculus chthonoplastes PCC 7420]|uniref:Uncharacterized protein n=1 Tax=Coleofasciculus chthonoplastes PCC 7420 TaxID=118168 RepID=B4VIY9_9CYAN|nr:hypothetical protein MC7420_7825 [Coleofasciculus chthonoplastes PCC 7420]
MKKLTPSLEFVVSALALMVLKYQLRTQFDNLLLTEDLGSGLQLMTPRNIIV